MKKKHNYPAPGTETYPKLGPLQQLGLHFPDLKVCLLQLPLVLLYQFHEFLTLDGLRVLLPLQLRLTSEPLLQRRHLHTATKGYAK